MSTLTVEALAKEIRQIDENYGAGDQLATALLPFIERHIAAGQTEDALVLKSLVAAGHVDQAKIDHARDIMRPLATPQTPKSAGDSLSLHGTAGRSVSRATAGGVGNPRDLISFAEGRIMHLNRGSCPDGIEGFGSRDPECAVCRAIDAALKPAGAVPLPEPAILSQIGREGWTKSQVEAYGDDREAAGRAVAVPEDFTTHRKAWRDGLNMAVRHAANADDAIYWMHEVRAFDRAYAELLPAAPIPQHPAAEGASGETLAVVCNCHLSPNAWRHCPHEPHRNQLHPIPTADADGWEENVGYLLGRCKHTIRVREGGGPESLLDSLVVTFIGMEQKLQAANVACTEAVAWQYRDMKWKPGVWADITRAMYDSYQDGNATGKRGKDWDVRALYDHPTPAAGKVTVDALYIPRSAKHDPIYCYFEDFGPGVGRITIACYGDAWTAAWNAMGNRTVREFVAQCDPGYLSGNLLQFCSGSKQRRKYTNFIAEAVIANLTLGVSHA